MKPRCPLSGILILLAIAIAPSRAQERTVFEVDLHVEDAVEFAVPNNVSYIEVVRVTGGRVEVVPKQPDGGGDHIRRSAVVLDEGLQEPAVPVSPGNLIRVVEQGPDDGSVRVRGVEVWNPSQSEAIRALADEMAKVAGGVSKSLRESMEASELFLREVAAEAARQVTDTIAARYQVTWKHKVVQIDFRDTGELRALLDKHGGPGLELIEVFADRRPGNYRGTVTAIYKRAVPAGTATEQRAEPGTLGLVDSLRTPAKIE